MGYPGQLKDSYYDPICPDALRRGASEVFCRWFIVDTSAPNAGLPDRIYRVSVLENAGWGSADDDA